MGSEAGLLRMLRRSLLPTPILMSGQVDKSALPISAPRRARDKEHLRYVASRPCLVCRALNRAKPTLSGMPSPGPWAAR